MIKLTAAATALALFLGGCNTTSRENTTYRFTETFTQTSIDGILESLDEAESIVTPNESFTLVITSPGGHLSAYYTLADRLHRTKLHTITKIHSYAASAGAMTFIAGDDRIMVRGSTVLFHNARFIIKGQHITASVIKKYLNNEALPSKVLAILIEMELEKENLEMYLKVLTDTNVKMFSIVETRLGKTVANKLLQDGKDVRLSAEEALELGVATSIEDFALARVQRKALPDLRMLP